MIAHGMYSMAVAARMVSGWAGEPAAIKRLKVRFSAMIEPGQTLTAKGEVAEVDDGGSWSASTPRTRRARRS